MTAPIPWYYMWSQLYGFFHHLLQDTMKEQTLKLQPIFLDQSVFDRELYKIDGHAWLGCSIKIDLLLERLKMENQAPYIIFSDIDILVKPGIYEKLQPYMDKGITMTFLKEGEHLNIGFILLKVCPEVIAFWELVKARMVEDPQHDQKYVNQMIGEYPGTWTTLDKKDFVCSNEWDGVSPYTVYQPLCSNLGKEFNVAEKLFYVAQLGVDMEPYMKYVPGEIIPYIYKFQEIVARSHQNSAS